MNGKYLLDTNIIISIFAKDPQIHNRLANAEEVFVSCIAIGELCFGAYKSLKTEENLARINEFAINNTVLACDTDTAGIYGDIKNRLKERGQRSRQTSGISRADTVAKFSHHRLSHLSSHHQGTAITFE